jgi:hypothetical protein
VSMTLSPAEPWDCFAFPSREVGVENAPNGLTKRELFAAMVLQGLCANTTPEVGQIGPEGRARCAVESADALLKVLSEPQREGGGQ